MLLKIKPIIAPYIPKKIKPMKKKNNLIEMYIKAEKGINFSLFVAYKRVLNNETSTP